MKINPEFNELSNSETLINHINELKRNEQIEKDIALNRFPVEVFPLPVQQIINATNENLNFPIDFIGSSMLYATSVAIGNTFGVEVKKGYQQNAVLYLAVVGPPGTNKSQPLSFAIEPIVEHDKGTYKHYEQQKLEYEKLINLTKKEREEQGYNEPLKPVWRKHLVSDFTPEALTDVHNFNKKGIGVYVDELAAWFKNFNRYNKGSEQEFWLSVWSGKPINIDRKTGEPVFIPKPFISVVGTIQNNVLSDLTKDSRSENGFIDRLLFAIPNDLKKEYWSENEIDPLFIENWNSIIFNILDLQIQYDDTQNPIPKLLRFTPEAHKSLYEWQREITDISNEPGNEVLRGIYAKMEMYAIRLALILELMRFACNNSPVHDIGLESVQGAIKLAEYFKNSAIRVHSIVSSDNPIDKLSMDKKNLYDALPDEFKTSEGVKIAIELGFAERTFKYFLKSRELFLNTERGEYKKQF